MHKCLDLRKVGRESRIARFPELRAWNRQKFRREKQKVKNLLMPLFLMGCFPVDFQDVKRPLRTKSVKRPIKVGKPAH